MICEEMAEEPLWIPVVEGHGGLAKNTDYGLRWIWRPVWIHDKLFY